MSQAEDKQMNSENCDNKTEKSAQVNATLSSGNEVSTNGTDNANNDTKEIPKNELALAYANRLVESLHVLIVVY